MQDINQATIVFDVQGIWVLNLALAAVMFGVALGITVTDFKKLFRTPNLLFAGFLSQFVLLPLVTFLLVSMLKPEPGIALGMFMVAACPGGNVSNFMTHLAKGNAALSVSLTAFATVLALFFTPFNFEFYGSLYPPTAPMLKAISIAPQALFEVVLLILGIPLMLGMLVRHYYKATALRLSRIFKPVSILVFLSIIVLAFARNTSVFSQFIHAVLFIGIAHNFVALALGYMVAKLFTSAKENIKTLTLETGIQNSGLGLLLIFTFFNGLGGMALLAAFWGIWHILSGLTLAFWWSKNGKA
ncbi:MAG TPA: bile acid:sodium symporter family protein [Flavobacteriaceae bacterium]|nr:bile acid:sodium symporter family protein [Flavobacteriaceae bacterium]